MVTRGEVISRARTAWRPGTVVYDQGQLHDSGYRQDCSGYVSMCWGIPPSEKGGWGGQSTVTLVTNGYMREIPPADLLPGDAVGVCGPGTGGDAGHIVIFERWANDDPANDDYWLWEQAGGPPGPQNRVVTYPYGGPWGDWKAYRFRDITEGVATPQPPTAGPVRGDYTPISPPELVKLNGVVRGDSVMQADVWGNEMIGHSPWGGPADKSYRGNQLDRIEEYARVAGGGSVSLTPEDISAIAAAILGAMPPPVSAGDIARELIAQLTQGSQR